MIKWLANTNVLRATPSREEQVDPVWRRAKFVGALLFALAMVAVNPVSAGIYKWVDENGKVHYSDKPQNANASELDVDVGGSSAAPAQTEAERKAKQQRLLDAFAKERADKQAAQAKAKQEKRERALWCAQARQELQELKEAGYVYDYDDDGNKIVYSDERRASATRSYESEIRAKC